MLHPPFSVAIDGYVNDGPKFQEEGPRANFDHHHGVSRLETRATCAQVLMAVRMGLFDCFRDENGPRLTVYANDCDQDVCTAWTILKNHFIAEQAASPLLNRLVSMEDVLDALQELAWVFEPYTQFRIAGGLQKRDASAFTSIVTDVERRILQHVVGKGESVPIDTRYERIGGGKGWTMVHEVGIQARFGMRADGIKAFVSVKERKDSRRDYVIARVSELIRFPVLRMFDVLNTLEGNKQEKWGGATTIGGSPRIAGSRLGVEEVGRVIEECVERKS